MIKATDAEQAINIVQNAIEAQPEHIETDDVDASDADDCDDPDTPTH